MIIEISAPINKIECEVNLPASKSISNRVLIIKAICKGVFGIENLSNAEDTLQLKNSLVSDESTVNAGDGGTTLRFLLAYYCLKGAEKIITASPALTSRPIAPLVNALRDLGASIDYLEEQGSLPVRINKGRLIGQTISVSGEVSSQFISALMLIGPYLENGIKIIITGEILSLPYINMTQSVMKYFGVTCEFNENVINILPGVYIEKSIVIEPDWSAASYWYEIVALSKAAKVKLKKLNCKSLQGDIAIANMCENFGVHTNYVDDGATLTKLETFLPAKYFSDDFTGCPDLGPAVALICGGLDLTADLKGLKNFRLKESDRAAALQRELYNMGVKTDFCGGSKFKVYDGRGIKVYNKPVNTYNDHRIAMSFAPLALVTDRITISDPEVVKKSYPLFFEDLQQAGFRIRTLSE